jgi:hypothetical protein
MAEKLVFESPYVTVTVGSPGVDAASRRPNPAESTPRDPMPVVVGCPRSGTSLLAVMLDSHSQLAVPPETAFLRPLQALAGAGDYGLRRKFFSIVTMDRLGISNWSDLGVDKDAYWKRLAAIEPFSIAAGVREFYAMYAEHANKARWGEKTPTYVLSMPYIASLLPEAHFIHIIRDARDTVLSWRKTWFAPAQDVAVIAREWVDHVSAGRAAARSVRRYLEVRYEDLVRQPETELKRVCAYLSLAYEPGMLDYAAQGAARIARLQSRAILNTSTVVPREERTRIHANLTRPPLAERIQYWKHEMTAAERQQVEQVAGALLRELGYDT